MSGFFSGCIIDTKNYIFITIYSLLPNGSAEAIQSLYTVLESLNRIEYGAFDSFNVMRDIPTDELVNISLSDLFRRVCVLVVHMALFVSVRFNISLVVPQ